MIWKKQPIANQLATLNSNLAIKSASNTDFNSYTGNTNFVERYTANSIASYTNVPSNASGQAWPFVLEVYKMGIYTKQILHIFLLLGNPPMTYIRQQTYSGGQAVWGDWYYTNLTKV